MILPAEFYARQTLEVARDLIGKVLVHRAADGVAAGIIVETEAYIGEDDPACHAAPGPTARNAPLYGPPGIAYVYLNYGLHHLVNAVTEPQGRPAAVLIRALEPAEGLALMRARRAAAPWHAKADSRSAKADSRGAKALAERRGRADTRSAKADPRSAKASAERLPDIRDADLCRGPGNLTRALGITLAQNTLPLTRPPLTIEDRGVAVGDLIWTPRIGISVGTDRPWRVHVEGHPAVSGRAPGARR